MNPRRCGAPARVGSNKIRPSALSDWFAQGIARCTRYTATVGVAPPHASAHSLGNASSLCGGRILKCFPHSMARSAARTVAGPTLKSEPAEVRGSCTGWRAENSALCRQLFALQAIARCTRYTATGRRSSHLLLLTPIEKASSLSGGRISNCFPRSIARSAARTVAGPTLKNGHAEVRGLRHG